jgi:hypothetical protein
MVWIVGLKILIKVGLLSLFGRYDYVEIKRFSKIIFFSYVGYLPVHNFASVMVTTTTCGESRAAYEGAYTVGGHEGLVTDIFIQHGGQHLCAS